MKPAVAFICTLMFYVLVGPPAGLLATILFYQGIELFHAAWSNIEFYWLHSLHCGPFVGGDCLYLIQRTTVSSLLFKQFGLLYSALSLRGLAVVYLFGFLPALLAGLLVGIGMLMGGRDFRSWYALALGCLVAIIFLAPIVESRNGFVRGEGVAWFIFTCAIATILCSLLVRLWWPRSLPAANASSRGA